MSWPLHPTWGYNFDLTAAKSAKMIEEEICMDIRFGGMSVKEVDLLSKKDFNLP